MGFIWIVRGIWKLLEVEIDNIFRQYNEIPEEPIITWSSVLLTSYQWGLSRIFSRAAKELKPLTFPVPVHKVYLVSTCHLPAEWAVNAITNLILREKSLTSEEGQKIGLEIVLIIAECRERIFRGSDSTLVLGQLGSLLSDVQLSLQRSIPF